LGVDARGRIALSILNFDVPHSEPARVAQARGAKGLVVMNWSDRDGPRVHTGTAKWTWGNPVPADLDQLPTIPVVSVSYEDGVYLRDVIAGQRAQVSIEAHLERRWVQAVQPTAEIRGAGDGFVLLHAHLDTFGFGMTDNATGVVGLLEVARALARCRDELGLSVRFVWWACHEMPYGGSTWYADAHWDDLRSNCVAALNADAWALPNSRDNLSAFASAEIQPMLRTILREVVGQDCVVQDWGVKQADQSFWGLGVPSALTVSLSPGEESTPLGTWFHSEFDTAENVDRDALDRLIRVHALAAYQLSVTPATSIDYAAVSARVAAELRDLSLTEPGQEYLAPLVERAEAVTRRIEELDGALDDPTKPLAPNGVSFCRALNSVLYSVAGPYGQDSQGAGYTGHRLPGLHQAVEGLDAAMGDDGRFAWLTQLLRERNRVADALAEADAILARVATRER